MSAEDEDDAIATMVDVAFPLAGRALPRDHRRLVAEALQLALPWMAGLAGAGVHRVNVVPGGGARALLSQRARLTLRVPRERAAELAALAGLVLDIAGETLRLGEPRVRELLPHTTLYCDFVAASDDDEVAFLEAVDTELRALGVPCRRICGRRQELDAGGQRLAGYSLMLYELSPADSRRVLEAGIGAHRSLGCGLFVPHRSAAAVGA